MLKGQKFNAARALELDLADKKAKNQALSQTVSDLVDAYKKMTSKEMFTYGLQGDMEYPVTIKAQLATKQPDEIKQQAMHSLQKIAENIYKTKSELLEVDQVDKYMSSSHLMQTFGILKRLGALGVAGMMLTATTTATLLAGATLVAVGVPIAIAGLPIFVGLLVGFKLIDSINHGRLTQEQQRMLICLSNWYYGFPTEKQFTIYFTVGRDELPSSYEEIQYLQDRKEAGLITPNGRIRLDCAAVAGVNNKRIKDFYHDIGSSLSAVAHQNPPCAELVLVSKKYIQNILGSCDSLDDAIKRCKEHMRNTHPDSFSKYTYDPDLHENIKTIFQLLGTLKDIFTSDECREFTTRVFQAAEPPQKPSKPKVSNADKMPGKLLLTAP